MSIDPNYRNENAYHLMQNFIQTSNFYQKTPNKETLAVFKEQAAKISPLLCGDIKTSFDVSIRTDDFTMAKSIFYHVYKHVVRDLSSQSEMQAKFSKLHRFVRALRAEGYLDKSNVMEKYYPLPNTPDNCLWDTADEPESFKKLNHFIEKLSKSHINLDLFLLNDYSIESEASLFHQSNEIQNKKSLLAALCDVTFYSGLFIIDKVHIQAYFEKVYELLKFLIENGKVNVNSQASEKEDFPILFKLLKDYGEIKRDDWDIVLKATRLTHQLKVIDLFLKNQADPNLRTEKGIPYLLKVTNLHWSLLKKLILAGLDVNYQWTEESNNGICKKNFLDVFGKNDDAGEIPVMSAAAETCIFYGCKTENVELLKKHARFFNIRANAEKLYAEQLERRKELYDTLDNLNIPAVLFDLIGGYENLNQTIPVFCHILQREKFTKEIAEEIVISTMKGSNVTIIGEGESLDEENSLSQIPKIDDSQQSNCCVIS